jgi:hypothetical protein
MAAIGSLVSSWLILKKRFSSRTAWSIGPKLSRKQARIIVFHFWTSEYNFHQYRRQVIYFKAPPFLAHLAFRPCELLSSLFVRRPSVNISHFNLLLRNHCANCNQTLVEWSLDDPFQNCVRWSRLPTKMGAKLKIEKRGNEILIVHCCFSVSQNELKF